MLAFTPSCAPSYLFCVLSHFSGYIAVWFRVLHTLDAYRSDGMWQNGIKRGMKEAHACVFRESKWDRVCARSLSQCARDDEMKMSTYKEDEKKRQQNQPKKRPYPIQIIQRNYSILSSLWYNSHFCSFRSFFFSLSISFCSSYTKINHFMYSVWFLWK